MKAIEDLFGNKRIDIPDNPTLQHCCEHLLDLIDRDKELLNGDSISDIDRKLWLALSFDNGLTPILQSGDTAKFKEWVMNHKLCVDFEVVSRARRYLSEHDFIRLSHDVITKAEQQRQRIAPSFKRH